MYDNKFYKLTY